MDSDPIITYTVYYTMQMRQEWGADMVSDDWWAHISRKRDIFNLLAHQHSYKSNTARECACVCGREGFRAGERRR